MFEVKSRRGGERLSVGCLPVVLSRSNLFLARDTCQGGPRFQEHPPRQDRWAIGASD